MNVYQLQTTEYNNNKDKYPLHRIDDLFDQSQGTIYFLRTVLRSGHHQLRIQEVKSPKTTFYTRYRYFEILVMSFGLRNVLVVFMDMMNRVSNPFLISM